MPHQPVPASEMHHMPILHTQTPQWLFGLCMPCTTSADQLLPDEAPIVAPGSALLISAGCDGAEAPECHLLSNSTWNACVGRAFKN